MQYIVGVTRKTNKKISQWVKQGGGYTSNRKEAQVYDEAEAKRVARSETDGRYRRVVQRVVQ